MSHGLSFYVAAFIIRCCFLFSPRQSIQKSTNDIIKTTSTDIKKLNSIVKFSSTEKTHQLMLEKIVSEFHTIVQKYLQSEKSISLKMRKTLLVNVNDDSDDDASVNASQQQKQLMQANLNFEKELLVEREQGFQRIESDVIDINQIMNEISTLIHGETNNCSASSSISELFFQTKARTFKQSITRFHKWPRMWRVV